MNNRCFLVFMAAVLVAPNAVAQNLIPDGGFEAASGAWFGGTITTEMAHGGGHSLEVNDNDPGGNVVAATVDPIPVEHGLEYAFEAWVRGAAPEQWVMLSVVQYDAADEWIPGGNLDLFAVAGTAWQPVRATLRSFLPETAALRLFLYPCWWSEDGSTTGTAWFDDLSLRATNPARQVPGEWLVTAGPVQVWQAPADHKVLRHDQLPQDARQAEAIELAAARNSSEAVQLVLECPAGDRLVAAEVSDLTTNDGATLQASAVCLREVAYVEVIEPTDMTCVADSYPDPLPLLSLPFELEATVQQPLWLQVRVPATAAAGQYTGAVALRFASAAEIELPLHLRVWDVALPQEHHLRTAYGLSLQAINTYHHLEGDPAALRQIWQAYLRDFAAHRVSPYDPFGPDSYTISYGDWNWLDGVMVPDPAAPGSDNRVLEVDDQSPDAAIAVYSDLAVPIRPDTGYTLRWRSRSDGSHDSMVVVLCYDNAGEWIPGANLDLVTAGDGSWQSRELTLAPAELHPDAVALRLALYARPWTEQGELVGRSWFDDVGLFEDGSGPNLVANGDFELLPEEVAITADWERFDPAAEWALEELHFDSFRLPLPGFPWGQLDSFWPRRLLGQEWGSAGHEEVFARSLMVVTDHLEERGWLHRAYAYWFDEPYPQMYPLVSEGMQLLHRADPRLQRLLTVSIEPELQGDVDIWVVPLAFYGPQQAAQQRAAGDEIWWYVATGPRGPYPNLFIDHDGLEVRLRFWMAWQLGVEGDVYWDTTFWTPDLGAPVTALQDPWSDPQSYGPDGTWGNGDGRLLYPPRGWRDGTRRLDEPVPSIRWELIREGLEDFESLWLLLQLADRLEERGMAPELAARARDLADLPPEVFSSINNFTRDPRVVADYRNQIAATLEQMAQLLAPRRSGRRVEPILE